MKKKKGRREKIIVILVIALIIITVVIIKNRTILGAFLGIKNNKIIADDIPEVNINYDNLASALSGSKLIQDLPKDGTIVLRFYNFNSGSREWEKSYILKKGEVVEDYTEDTDMVITLRSDYLGPLTNKNFCSMVQTANQRGDLGLEYQVSKATILWKFKSMMKYGDCFGF